MKKGIHVLIAMLVFMTVLQPGYASSVARTEMSGRAEESPVGILYMNEEIFVLFQEPASLVRYDQNWTETGVLELPDEFSPTEMIIASEEIWVLDEREGQVLKVNPTAMKIISNYMAEYPRRFVSLFEVNGNALLLDDTGYVYSVGETFETLGWLSGLKLFQSVFFDGFQVYLGGRIRPAESGVLVKTVEDEKIDEWLMSDDRRAPVDKDVVERIRLLSDGFFYIMYQDTGIVKYDDFGNYRNRIYKRSTEERTFYDITYVAALDKYFMVDKTAGVFEAKWSWDRRVAIKKTQEDTSGQRLSVRTVRGVTSAQVGVGRLLGFYREADDEIRIMIPTRDVDTLKLRMQTSDLLQVEERGINQLHVNWKEQEFSFAIDSWTLGLYDREEIEEQYVEIRVEAGKVVVDHCIVERIDEMTKRVRRENLE